MSKWFDYEQFKTDAIVQLRSGRQLIGGKDGVWGFLLENFLNRALGAEMDHIELAMKIERFVLGNE